MPHKPLSQTGLSARNRWVLPLVVCALVATIAGTGSAMTFHFDTEGDLAAMQSGTATEQQTAADIVACFEAAGAIWSARLTDSIKINVNIEFTDMGTSVLGSTESFSLGHLYSSVRGALAGDGTTPDDITAISHLQMGASLDIVTNDTSVAPPATAPRIRDHDGSTNNTTLDLNRANAKAVGLLNGNNPGADGAVSFSSDMTWDFDRGDGISSGKYDFIGVAIHELGHVLGVVSGVDVVDYTAAPDGPSAPLDLNGYRVFSAWDLYRYSADSLAEPNQPAIGAVLDLAVGGTPYFSIDAGATNLARVESGRENGSGRQASHWKDGLGLGIMDPTLSSGRLSNLTSLDLLAMDVIGYDRTAASWGDFNDDGSVGAGDIDALYDALAAGTGDVTYDINYNSAVTQADVDVLIRDLLDTEYGDADLDGDIDLDDFVILKAHFGAADASWGIGDFSGNGSVNLDDFIMLKSNFGFAGLPEPGSVLLLATGALATLRRRRTDSRRSR